MTSSRRRTSIRKAASGEDRKDVQQPEDVQPLIVRREGQVDGTPQKLVVNVETLTFRPMDGSRLQTARRGRPFTPGNLRGGGRAKGIGRGVLQNEAAFKDKISVDTDDSKKDLIGDDNIVTDESTSYNEWLAAQGLVGLSGEQPAHGDIRKLHKKDCDEVVNEDKTIDNDNTQVVKAPEMRPKKIIRSDYVKSKLKISKAKKTLLLKGSKKQKQTKQKCTAKSSAQKKIVEKNTEREISGLTQMKNLQKQVEDMIREGKTDADSQARIETLKGILSMLQGPKVDLKDDTDIHKIGERDGSIKTEDKSIVSSQESTEISKDNTNTINVIKKDENVTLKVQFESSDEFNSDDYSVTKAVDCINTTAQLDDTVTDTGQQDKVDIESIVNELIDAFANEEEHGTGDAADDLSSIPLCSEMPQINPHSHKQETSPDDIR